MQVVCGSWIDGVSIHDVLAEGKLLSRATEDRLLALSFVS
jgi:hypothetical protein